MPESKTGPELQQTLSTDWIHALVSNSKWRKYAIKQHAATNQPFYGIHLRNDNRQDLLVDGVLVSSSCKGYFHPPYRFFYAAIL